ncbi:MAG TPA: hypothetical protein VFG56_02945 [Candidatus Saccharimonadales bacterium]|nr:hypothetical protein [Candidatus Saccharimonadales bacterium]
MAQTCFQKIGHILKDMVDECGGAYISTREDYIEFIRREAPTASELAVQHFTCSLRRHGLTSRGYHERSNDVVVIFDTTKFDFEQAVAHVEMMGLPEAVQIRLFELDVARPAEAVTA